MCARESLSWRSSVRPEESNFFVRAVETRVRTWKRRVDLGAVKQTSKDYSERSGAVMGLAHRHHRDKYRQVTGGIRHAHTPRQPTKRKTPESGNHPIFDRPTEKIRDDEPHNDSVKVRRL